MFYTVTVTLQVIWVCGEYRHLATVIWIPISGIKTNALYVCFYGSEHFVYIVYLTTIGSLMLLDWIGLLLLLIEVIGRSMLWTGYKRVHGCLYIVVA